MPPTTVSIFPFFHCNCLLLLSSFIWILHFSLLFSPFTFNSSFLIFAIYCCDFFLIINHSLSSSKWHSLFTSEVNSLSCWGTKHLFYFKQNHHILLNSLTEIPPSSEWQVIILIAYCYYSFFLHSSLFTFLSWFL